MTAVLGTDITWKYVDRRAAAINALRDFSTMQTIIDTTDDDLKAIAEDIPSISSPAVDGRPIAPFNPHAHEDRIVKHLERIDNRQRRYLQARDYMDWFLPAWAALSDDERWMLESCYLGEDTMQTDAIIAICDRFHIERSSAYNKKNRALNHFATLLYGR
ncbi:hypothetical protein BSR28_08695 [Boudabousia liubingyangii]|uniref:hypothetical protein n=1 Tax=Boudabousia liubingyangii TaxID=1921764 RepID=UPI000939144B|nr:hypothetical protein [Boudabousia liubingyangii]OKL45940.1 hypothetical protein BSR28_08695 [Boudabousia liubingyangii]